MDLLLVIVVGAALAFDFTNGFHDTANVVASSISTRALSPRAAIAIASILNFAGAFISLKVAATVATGIINSAQVTERIAFAALIGGVVGAMLAAVGGGGVRGQNLVADVVIPALVAPLLAFVVAGVSIVLIYRIVGRRRPGW